MKKELIEKLKQALEIEKDSVHKELERFASEDPKLKHNWEAKYPNREDGDKDEQADDAQEYDTALSLEHSFELKLKDVVMALEKIAAGKYGICENCGKEITEARLLACPEAKTCLHCHKK